MTETKNPPFRLGPNEILIGQPDSRTQLATPCLVLERSALFKNIEAAAAFCREKGIALRPHAKSHKSAEIAKLQVAAGSAGVCVATVGEAEAMAEGGITDLLITSDFTQPNKMRRAAALVKQGCKLSIVADDPDMVVALGKVAEEVGIVFDVLLDVDLGRHRNGITTLPQAIAVAEKIVASRSLHFGGIQAYASHISHLETYKARKDASDECARFIAEVRAAVEGLGLKVERVTGGSTGTLFMDPGLFCYTELQCGSYVFNDVEYRSIDIDGKGASPFEPSLFVMVSVLCRNTPGRVACDGGNKHFSAKGTLPGFYKNAIPGAVYRPDSDEHGIIELPDGAVQPALGTSFDLIVPHCDPTVNLYNQFHLVDGDRLIAIWPIEARGAF